MKQVELAEAIGHGYTHSLVSMIERGLKPMRFDRVVRSAQVLNVSVDYLAGLTDDPTPTAQLVPARTKDEAPKVIEFPGGHGRAIAVRELQAAAGGGALDLDETVTGYVYFRTSWLRKHGLNPDRCSVIGVVGESMEPTLRDGSAILLDQDRRRRRVGSIFVVRGPDGLIVKRAGKDDRGAWILASDHPGWESTPWPDNAEIVGHVAWSATTLP